MTRINASIRPHELCNSMLFAEYREIKRIPNKLKNGKYNFKSVAPLQFTLNTGHELFFRDKILYLKKRSDLLYTELLKRGFDVEDIDKSIDEYIANALYKTLKKTSPQKIEYLFEIMHKEVSKDYLNTYKGLTHIETLLKFYKNELTQLQVKEKNKRLIKLPKPQKRLFKRIISGKGEYNDYKLVK